MYTKYSDIYIYTFVLCINKIQIVNNIIYIFIYIYYLYIYSIYNVYIILPVGVDV